MVIDYYKFLETFVPDYEKQYKEQEEECESIVFCSCSINGMNPDALAAQGLMLKFEEDSLFETLKNYSEFMVEEYSQYIHEAVGKGYMPTFKNFWNTRFKECLTNSIKQNGKG